MALALTSFYFPIRTQNVYTNESLKDATGTTNVIQYKLGAMVMFFTLQILGGHVGIPIVLMTLYNSKGLRRHVMLINFLATWVIYSTSFCVLLYLGKQFGPEPSNALCIFQASAIYGTAVLSSTAGLCFVLYLWLSIRDVASNKVGSNSWRHYALLVTPYVLFAIFMIFTAVLGSTEPTQVSRNRYLFYCTIHSSLVDIVPGTSALLMCTVITFEVLIGIRLYRMHKAFPTMNAAGASSSLNLAVRVGIFSIYSFLSIIASISFWSETGNELPYIIQASLPTAAFLIFGTQQDILQAWGVIRFWSWIKSLAGVKLRAKDKPSSSPQVSESLGSSGSTVTMVEQVPNNKSGATLLT